MSTFNVILTFTETKTPIPDEDVLLPGLPSRGDILRTTPKFLDDSQEQNDWETAITWEVVRVEMLFKHPHRTEVLVTLVPYTGGSSIYRSLAHELTEIENEPLELGSVPFASIPIENKQAVLKEMGFKVREGYIFDEHSEIEWQVTPRSQEAEGDALVLTWHEDD